MLNRLLVNLLLKNNAASKLFHGDGKQSNLFSGKARKTLDTEIENIIWTAIAWGHTLRAAGRGVQGRHQCHSQRTPRGGVRPSKRLSTGEKQQAPPPPIAHCQIFSPKRRRWGEGVMSWKTGCLPPCKKERPWSPPGCGTSWRCPWGSGLPPTAATGPHRRCPPGKWFLGGKWFNRPPPPARAPGGGWQGGGWGLGLVLGGNPPGVQPLVVFLCKVHWG